MSNENLSTTSKNLGLVKAIHEGVTPPTNIKQIWVDTSAIPFVHKVYNQNSETWVEIGSVGSVTAVEMNMGNVLYVSKEGNDGSAEVGSMLKPYLTIGAAVTAAIALSPTQTARVAIKVSAGHYDETVTLSNDYIDIHGDIQQKEVFSRKNIDDAYLYSTHKRTIKVTTIDVQSENTILSGIDVETLNFGVTSANKVQRYIHNMFIKDITSDTAVASTQYVCMTDIVAETVFPLDEDVYVRLDIRNCLFNKLFENSGYDTGDTITNSIIADNLVTVSECMGYGAGFDLQNSELFNCTFGDNNFRKISNTTIRNCIFGDENIFHLASSDMRQCILGTACIKDFVSSTIKQCKSLGSIGLGGSEEYLSGVIDDVDSTYTNGFAGGRYFFGEMRNMTIKANTTSTALRIKYTGSSVPATVERCTILNCGSGETMSGDKAIVCYCKFNKGISNVNSLGADNKNLVSTQFCQYSDIGTCATPSAFALTAVNNLWPAIFSFSATLPETRAGAIVEITYPSGATEERIVEVVEGTVSTNITFNISISNAPDGQYSFRIKTVCTFDDELAATLSSDWRGGVSVTYTKSTEILKAWRGISPACVQGYSTYGLEELNTGTGTHKLNRLFDDGTLSFTYRLYYVTTGQTSSLYTVSFLPGKLVSEEVTGIEAIGGVTTILITDGSYTGTRSTDNTGYEEYQTLEEYTVSDGIATGTTKDNDSGDPDYIPPYADAGDCPVTEPRETAWRGYEEEGHYECQLAYADYTGVTELNTGTGEHKLVRDIDDNNGTGVNVNYYLIEGVTQHGPFSAHFSGTNLESDLVAGQGAIATVDSVELIDTDAAGNNDGQVRYTSRELYYTDDDSSTGIIRDNTDAGHPDYVAQEENLTLCPLP